MQESDDTNPWPNVKYENGNMSGIEIRVKTVISNSSWLNDTEKKSLLYMWTDLWLIEP